MVRDLVEVAKEAVRRASGVCARVRSSASVGETAKSDRSPVTIADFASQATVSRLLAEARPDLPLVAEEGSEELRKPEMEPILERVAEAAGMPPVETLRWIDRGRGGTGSLFWTLDPVDGTKGFLRNEQYAIALALIEEGRVLLGVLGCPNLAADGSGLSAGGSGTLFWAVRGRGAWQQPLAEALTPQRLQVSRARGPSELRVCESVEAGHSRHDLGAVLKLSLGIRADPVRLDSQAKYGIVARGDADVYWRLPTLAGYEERIWDHAAGALLVEEAGGRVTDVGGRPLDFSRGRTLASNRGVVCTHGPCHEAVVEAIARASGAPGRG